MNICHMASFCHLSSCNFDESRLPILLRSLQTLIHNTAIERTRFSSEISSILEWIRSNYRRNFDLDKKNETITIGGKSILK